MSGSREKITVKLSRVDKDFKAGLMFQAKEIIEEIVKKTSKDSSKAGIFNNAGQHWNHILFWKCMKPKGGGAMPPELEKRIVADFGSVDKFKEESDEYLTPELDENDPEIEQFSEK